MRRFLIVTQMFPSSVRGTLGTFVAARAKALAKLGNVRVIVPTPWFPPIGGMGKYSRFAQVERSRVTDEGAIVFYPRYMVLPKTATWLQGFTMARAVRRQFHLSCGSCGWWPDVIDAHMAFPDGYAARRLATQLGCKCFVTCHGSDLAKCPSVPIAAGMLRETLCRVDRVLAVSEPLRQRAVELGCPPHRALFLPAAVDAETFAPFDQEQCRSRLHLPPSVPIALCVASLDDNKNQQTLLRALALMEGPGALHLALVGGGPGLAKLRRLAGELKLLPRVTFAGPRPYDEIPLWMSAATWVVLASRREGWPTVYFESFACGCPVITSRVDAALEAIPDERYGLVVEPNTPEQWARVLGDAVTHRFDRIAIRQYAQQHTWERWGRAYMNILEGLLETQPAEEPAHEPDRPSY